MSEFLSFRLSEEFIEPYKTKEVPWGFSIGGGNSLSELTFVLKYSRKKEDGTKEKWWEVCQRCVEGTQSILKDHAKANKTTWNDLKAQKTARDAYDRMFNFKWTPPGRGLQHMGTRYIAESRNGARLINCLAGETEVITQNGILPIKDLIGTSQTLLTTDGWVEAPISSFGNQELYEITMTKNGVEKIIRATGNHRWFVRDRRKAKQAGNGFKEVLTKDLVADVHQFQSVYGQGVKSTNLSPVGVAAGFFYGDGNRTVIDRHSNRVRLCGEKDLAMLKYFSAHRTQAITDSGDIFVCDFPNYFKDLPSLSESKSYLVGWLAGYFAADGSKGSTDTSIASADLESLKYVKSICAIVGIGTGVIQKAERISNLTDKPSVLYKLPIRPDTLTEEFFINRNHRENFQKLVKSSPDWYVKSVVNTGIEEEVYCATVDGIGNFTLSENILTGNCAGLSSEKISTHSAYDATMPFVRLIEMSMNGIGVGLDCRGAGNIVIHQPLEETVEHVIEDTREAWGESLGVLLESFFFKNRKTVKFDYSKIRKEGALLKSFGGTASGPGPLKRMHEKIVELFSNREGELITSRDITDLANLSGKAAVSGGARRAALIMFGFQDDSDFVNLKNWELPENAERTGPDGWAWASNNSILATVDEDLSGIIPQIAVNGEPGIIWTDLMQNYGRLIDPPDFKDTKVNVTNPCGEIPLEGTGELCCLAELYPTNHDSIEDLKASIKHAYMYAKAVVMLPTPWAETNEVIMRNRRIGVSMTGVAQFVETRPGGWTTMKKWMDEGYRYLSAVDVKYSSWLGIRESVRLATIKPAGSTSLLAGVTPGIHWPTTGDFHLRRIRFLNTDPLVSILTDAGYHFEPDVNDPIMTVVGTFPTTGVSMRSEREVSVWEKAGLAAFAQRYWSDNMVSCTLSFREEEIPQLGPLLSSFQGQFKGVSFLPIHDEGTTYAQAPYEPVSEKDALEWQAKVKPLDQDVLYQMASEFVEEKFCNSDSCLI